MTGHVPGVFGGLRPQESLLGGLTSLTHILGRALDLGFDLGPVGDHLGRLVAKFLIATAGLVDGLFDFDGRVHGSLCSHAKECPQVIPDAPKHGFSLS